MFTVDRKYHKLIYQGDRSFSDLVKSETDSNPHVIIILIITYLHNSFLFACIIFIKIILICEN